MTTKKPRPADSVPITARINADLWRNLKLYSVKQGLRLTEALEAAIEGLLKKA